METLGRISHFRLGDSGGWVGRVMSEAEETSLELSMSTGVVALLDPDAGADERSEASDKDERELSEEEV
jgi:hypothetical protein